MKVELKTEQLNPFGFSRNPFSIEAELKYLVQAAVERLAELVFIVVLF